MVSRGTLFAVAALCFVADAHGLLRHRYSELPRFPGPPPLEPEKPLPPASIWLDENTPDLQSKMCKYEGDTFKIFTKAGGGQEIPVEHTFLTGKVCCCKGSEKLVIGSHSGAKKEKDAYYCDAKAEAACQKAASTKPASASAPSKPTPDAKNAAETTKTAPASSATPTSTITTTPITRVACDGKEVPGLCAKCDSSTSPTLGSSTIFKHKRPTRKCGLCNATAATFLECTYSKVEDKCPNDCFVKKEDKPNALAALKTAYQKKREDMEAEIGCYGSGATAQYFKKVKKDLNGRHLKLQETFDKGACKDLVVFDTTYETVEHPAEQVNFKNTKHSQLVKDWQGRTACDLVPSGSRDDPETTWELIRHGRMTKLYRPLEMCKEQKKNKGAKAAVTAHADGKKDKAATNAKNEKDAANKKAAADIAALNKKQEAFKPKKEIPKKEPVPVKTKAF